MSENVYVIICEPRGLMPEIDFVFKNEELAEKFYEIHCDTYDQRLIEMLLIDGKYVEFEGEIVEVEYSDDKYIGILEHEDFYETYCVVRSDYYKDKDGNIEVGTNEEYPIVKINDLKKNRFDGSFEPSHYFNVSKLLSGEKEKERIEVYLSLRFEEENNSTETIKKLENRMLELFEVIQQQIFEEKKEKETVEEWIIEKYKHFL